MAHASPGRVLVRQHALRLRTRTRCGHPGSEANSGLVAYLEGEPVGWWIFEERNGLGQADRHRLGSASWPKRPTASRPSMRRRARRSPRWWSATTASSAAAGAWGSSGGSAATTPALNRERKLGRVRARSAHAALVFDGAGCVGSCQFGTADEVPRITSRAAYEKGRTTVPDWRIACCYVGKGHRRQGVATAALAGAVDLIAGLGGERSGVSGGRRHGARRLPLQRRPVDLREARLHPRPQDRQAPLGRDQGRRAEVVSDGTSTGIVGLHALRSSRWSYPGTEGSSPPRVCSVSRACVRRWSTQAGCRVSRSA